MSTTGLGVRCKGLDSRSPLSLPHGVRYLACLPRIHCGSPAPTSPPSLSCSIIQAGVGAASCVSCAPRCASAPRVRCASNVGRDWESSAPTSAVEREHLGHMQWRIGGVLRVMRWSGAPNPSSRWLRRQTTQVDTHAPESAQQAFTPRYTSTRGKEAGEAPGAPGSGVFSACFGGW